MSQQLAIEIVPAVLEESLNEVRDKFVKINGKVKRIHVDVIDGIFADNLTIGVGDLRDVDFLDLKVDVHLMTEYPVDFLGECHNVGIDRAFGQIEHMNSQSEFIETCKELTIKPGLALDLYTPVESLDMNLLSELHGILLMSVKAGHSGQPFDKGVVKKVEALRDLGFAGDIQVDGGLDQEKICLVQEVGATQVAVNSYLWGTANLDDALQVLCSE